MRILTKKDCWSSLNVDCVTQSTMGAHFVIAGMLRSQKQTRPPLHLDNIAGVCGQRQRGDQRGDGTSAHSASRRLTVDKRSNDSPFPSQSRPASNSLPTTLGMQAGSRWFLTLPLARVVTFPCTFSESPNPVLLLLGTASDAS